MLPFLLPLLGMGVSAIGGAMQSSAQQQAERENERTRLEAEARNEASRLEMDAKNMAIQEENSKIPQIFRSEVDLKKLVSQSEAAGFNPLTVLRAGGLSAYGIQTNPNLPKQSLYTSSNFGGSNLQGHSPLGTALSTVGSGLAQYDIGAIQMRQIEQQVAQATIRNINTDTSYKSHMMRVPSYEGAQSYRGGNFNSGLADDASTVKVAGYKVKQDGGFSPTQVIEDRYGDVVSWVYGVGVLAADALENIGFKKAQAMNDVAKIPGAVENGVIDFARWLDARKATAGQRTQYENNWFQQNQSARMGAGGIGYKTGGGF